MALIRNLVPYEIEVQAHDTKSGRKISNRLYYRSDDSGGGYGVAIGGSSQATFQTAVIGMWNTFPMSELSINYLTDRYVQQVILGRRYPTPLLTITGISALLIGTRVVLASAHGMSVGQTVLIQGVGMPTSINGTFVITGIASPTEFDITYTYTGGWTGDGVAQLIQGQQQFLYADRLETNSSVAGSKTGEAIPIYNSVSMRRPNAGVGRNWRSRLSLAIIPESGQINGKLEATALTNWTTVGQGMDEPCANGTNNMNTIAVSKQIAFAQVTPFTSSVSWTRLCSDFIPQPNLGSQVKRKPRLTATIS